MELFTVAMQRVKHSHWYQVCTVWAILSVRRWLWCTISRSRSPFICS